MVSINTGVDDGNRDAIALVVIPHTTHVQIIQVGLQFVVSIKHRVLGSHGQPFPVFFLFVFQFADLYLVVSGHFVNVLQAFVHGIHIQDSSAFWQFQRCKAAVLRNAQFCAV